MKRMSLKAHAVVLIVLFALAPSASARTLVPGGQSIGVAMKTGSIVVVGSSDIGAIPSPARLAGLRSGDVITAIDGISPGSADAIAGMLTGSQCRITAERGGEEFEVLATPAYDKSDGAYKLGVWVRDSAAGIGTLTYVDPETRRYGALGHPITDADAGIVLPVDAGTIYENSIIGVERGASGSPGEILGQFYDGEELGSVEKNNEYGIFGSTGEHTVQTLYPDGLETMPKEQLHTGSAQLLTTVDGRGLMSFECEIIGIDMSPEARNRSFTLRITDKELLRITGGIVQGMSGSPVIQDGRLAGAVTHVFVDDPARGYGVFIENMLDTSV